MQRVTIIFIASVDVFSLGIMVYEWLYGLLSNSFTSSTLFDWFDERTGRILNKLEDEEDDPTVTILNRMTKIKGPSRWPATKCLAQGFKERLFK